MTAEGTVGEPTCLLESDFFPVYEVEINSRDPGKWRLQSRFPGNGKIAFPWKH
jgi:hypothetical protein